MVQPEIHIGSSFTIRVIDIEQTTEFAYRFSNLAIASQ